MIDFVLKTYSKKLRILSFVRFGKLRFCITVLFVSSSPDQTTNSENTNPEFLRQVIFDEKK